MTETLVLPGFSPRNLEWAKEVKSSLDDVVIVEWPHWTGTEFNIGQEVEKLQKQVEGKRVNIIAKSIGTYVVMRALPSIASSVDKLVLCGVPFHDLSDIDKESYGNLGLLSRVSIVCFQNSQDTHGSFKEVRNFLPSIDIREKPGDTHDYPYYSDFSEFLKD